MKKASDSIKVQTNNTKGSICKVEIEPITFEKLWTNYPDNYPYVDKKTGKPPVGYENQCAIKISSTFHKSGIEMKSYAFKDKITLNGKNTAILAENLAQWLKLVPFCGLPQKPEDITGENWQDKIKGKTGILFFKDYWLRKGEKTSSGDHIDLWNKDRLTPGLASFWRFTLGFDTSWLFDLSNLGDSKQILFWEIK
jgi:hypothetical protein